MNILIVIDSKIDIYNYMITLKSLFFNNDAQFTVVCGLLGVNASECNEIERLVINSNSRIKFVKLSNKIDIIMNADKIVEDNSNRALFVSSDTIFNCDISSFYNISFNGNILIARGQTAQYRLREGARPERSQIFDCRLFLINLKKLKMINICDLVNESICEYGHQMNFASMLNCIFISNTKILYDISFNIRHSIYCDAETNNMDIINVPIYIVSFEKRDYYGLGLAHLPWQYNIDDKEYEKHLDKHEIIIPINKRQSYELSRKIIKLWKYYYDITFEQGYEKVYRNVYIEDVVQNKFLNNSFVYNINNIQNYQNLEFDEVNKILSVTEYEYIGRYIDSLQSTEAIDFMKKITIMRTWTLRNKKVIKVGFVVHSSSEWQCEKLYEKMVESKSVEPSIIVGYQKQGEPEIYYSLRDKTEKYFEQNHNVLSSKEIEEQIDYYDVLIYISPYDVFPECLNVERRKASQVIIHVPYSYYLVSKDDAIYNEPFYERNIFKIAWLVCAANEFEIEIAKEHQRLKAYNYEFTGFPKMDIFYEKSCRMMNDLWRRKDNIKIIWAPHFNMVKGMNGTFYYNYEWFYNYAKKHEEISWIVRPHPRFASGAIAAGVFSDLVEVNNYFKKWEELPNARVIDGGDYYKMFITSDAMILDSISFLAEYQFTGKPLLFLYPDIPRGMNKLGRKLLEVVYKAKGDDFESIEKFINDIKRKNDNMYDLRRTFFDEQLNYCVKNKKLATDYIWEKIESLRK